MGEKKALRDARAKFHEDARIKREEDEWLKKVLEKKAQMKRDEKMQRERNQESLKEWNSQRWPIFAAAIRNTELRRQARESEEEAVRGYHEQRAIPKKEKTKGAAKKKAKAESNETNEPP